jgi:hypothetical protein
MAPENLLPKGETAPRFTFFMTVKQ